MASNPWHYIILWINGLQNTRHLFNYIPWKVTFAYSAHTYTFVLFYKTTENSINKEPNAVDLQSFGIQVCRQAHYKSPWFYTVTYIHTQLLLRAVLRFSVQYTYKSIRWTSVIWWSEEYWREYWMFSSAVNEHVYNAIKQISGEIINWGNMHWRSAELIMHICIFSAEYYPWLDVCLWNGYLQVKSQM